MSSTLERAYSTKVSPEGLFEGLSVLLALPLDAD